MTCGFEDAVSRIVTVPFLFPIASGLKATLMAQLAPGATLVLHVVPLFRLNCPCTEMDEIDNVLAPLFVRITACGLLVVLRSCGENLTGVIGEKPTTPVLRRTLTWLKR
jgi:hypothetical protein